MWLRKEEPLNLWELPDFAAPTEDIEGKFLLYSDRHAKTRGIQDGAVNFI